MPSNNLVDSNDVREKLVDPGSSTSPSSTLTIERIGWAVLFLVGALGEAVSFKRVLIAAPNYSMALVMLLGLTGLIGYPIVVSILYYSKYLEWKHITVTWWKPAIVGLCFVLHDIFLKTGGRGDLPGVLILVLSKLAIPCSMFFSMLPWTLGNKYGRNHWAALLILLFGVVFMVGPHMTFHGHHDRGATVEGDVFKVILVACSTVPLAVAFVLLEMWLKREDKDVFPVAFWMWVCAFMVPISLALAPLNAHLAGVPSEDIWPNLIDGLGCFVLGDGPDPAVDCAAAQTFWSIAIFFGFMMNIAMPLCTKHGSATFLWFVKSLTLPLGGILFSMAFFMGDAARPMEWQGWVGLVCVGFAVACFNSVDPTKRQ